jgi:predicted ribosome quality control (RQC) complex YloA/Tae2 family protein
LSAPGGLTAAELALALAEIEPALAGMRVRDAAKLAARDDLLLWFDGDRGRATLQIALGAARARLTLTQRRFQRDEFETGPRIDQLREQLLGCALAGVVQPGGERRCSLVLRDREQARRSLEVELFGARGLWALLDAGGRILALSRLPEAGERVLRPGEVYAPPTGQGRRAEPPPRFAPPVLAAIDAWYTALDERSEHDERRERVALALARAIRSLDQKIAGLERQRQQALEAPALRRRADLLLAYAAQWKRGQGSLVVPDPDAPDRTIELAPDPLLPPPVQAEKLYAQARTLEGAVEIGAQRIAEADAERARLRERQQALDAAGDAGVAALEQELRAAGRIRTQQPPPPAARARKPAAPDPLAGLRRFESAEGMTILCGRSNEQNDRLSIRIARGNDLWFHVGGGRAGSHVVVRLPKGRNASLETILDAATIAVHFSKARGEPLCEVVYTPAKNVRKPKGLPPGRVTITNEKSLRVRLEPDRLRRLLASGC